MRASKTYQGHQKKRKKERKKANKYSLLYCQRVIFKGQHPGLQLPIIQAHQHFLGKVKCVGQRFWVTQMQCIDQCKKHDNASSVCGDLNDHLTIKNDPNLLCAEDGGISWIGFDQEEPNWHVINLFGSPDPYTVKSAYPH